MSQQEHINGETITALQPVIVDETMDLLKKQAAMQLERIVAQSKRFTEYQSTMDLLMKRYHVDESYIGQLSLWYGNLHWFMRLGLMSAVVSVASTVGVILNASILLGGMVFLLCSTVHILLTDYYEVSERRDERLCKDIMELEKSIAESVQHMSAIEDSLKETLVALCNLRIEEVNQLAVFKEQVTFLQTKLQVLNDMAARMDETKSLLVNSSETMIAIQQQTNQQLSTAVDQFIHDKDTLHSLANHFEQSNDELTTMINTLRQLLEKLQAQADANHQVAVSYSSQSSETLSEAELLLQRLEQGSSNPVLDNSADKTTELLSRADDFIAALQKKKLQSEEESKNESMILTN